MGKGSVGGTPLRVARDAVIRFLLDAQHLAHGGARGPGTAPTPPAVLREIRHLEGVQIDPVSVVERNQHLVLAARHHGRTHSNSTQASGGSVTAIECVRP